MLKVGTELILEADHRDEIEKYKAKIEDFNGNEIYISYPINLKTNKTAFMKTGIQMIASFVDQESNAFSFKTKVIDRIKNRIPLIVLSFPGDAHLIKVQRRQFVRIETSIDVALQMSDSDVQFTAITEDFSAGGCAIIIPNKVKVKQGETANIHIVLPSHTGENIYLHTKCEVVRIFEKNNIHGASLKFTNLNHHQERQLIRFCFEKQLEYRKREMPN
ncbi:flagellar brake protein [Lederbergia citrea]|nr:flagellar brake domain-containing protein [Lederbergia citrea]MBS4176548.1 flagellar brake domain-containing protein [Lederbergia citrea]MBS4203109.1 flagellar brake domain-containing protein [Lederbergia citrea]